MILFSTINRHGRDTADAENNLSLGGNPGLLQVFSFKPGVDYIRLDNFLVPMWEIRAAFPWEREQP